MADTPDPILEYLRTIHDLDDTGTVITPTELRALVWFFIYGENVLSQIGGTWRGCSFRQNETTCLLVVKATIDDLPQVAFITARTPTDCVVTFCKQWHADRVKWNNDKYA